MRYLRLAAAAALLSLAGLFAVPVVPVIAQNVACYLTQGGAAFTVGSGCTVTVASSGVINVASGGALQFAGVDQTTALSTAPAAVAAGYKIARGETALDGSNPTPATTGLTTIVACSATIKATAAPGVGTSIVTYGSSSGTLNLYGWKVTATGDATLIASTGTETIGWVCVGT